ncbi:unnamed protein product [Clavelina lepadiformis]|uniref:LCCL domain-containing protein n=1 Tax=Clavelina lepadiformis TaxID=159417 RepID=A0ABP0FUX6_CLALP
MTYTCATNARQQYDMFFSVQCPKSSASQKYRVWGKKIYAHDSSICRAAIHDGRLTDTPISCETPVLDKRFALLNVFQIVCPPGCLKSSAKVWGRVVSSDHSSLCKTAIRNGKITNAGGEVTIFTQPGQPSYKAEERNIVNSSLMDYSHSSFSLTPDVPGRDPGNLTCPSGYANTTGDVWGSGIYTHDFAVCRAAIHDGRIADHGGSVTFYRQLGQSSYLGTQGNSVTSKPSGYWKTSFSFATELTEAPDCTTTADEPMFYTQSSSKIFSPPSSADSASNVWGIFVHASVSSICKAAIHDGRISSKNQTFFKPTCFVTLSIDINQRSKISGYAVIPCLTLIALLLLTWVVYYKIQGSHRNSPDGNEIALVLRESNNVEKI